MSRHFIISLVAFAALFAAYTRVPAAPTPTVTINGIVAGSYFIAPVGPVPSSTVASYFSNVKVCVDADDDNTCNPGEATAITDANGAFVLASAGIGPLIADISTASLNGGHAVTERSVFRASLDQVAESLGLAQPVAITPLSTEVVRMMEAGGTGYATTKHNLAVRLSVPDARVTGDPNTPDASQAAVLAESVVLSKRFALAAKMVDRLDVSPAALFLNPAATGPAITLREAQQAAMNLESIPRYDHIFIIMLENRQTVTIKNSPFAPKINSYLYTGNQFTSYNATGNPSEPNYTALGGADDFGITDDNGWNCVAAGDTANQVEDLPLPAGVSACTNATNHNIKNKPNLFNAMSAGGMTWRVYNESQNPGRDWRSNSAADNTLLAPDHIYPAGSPVGAIGNSSLQLRFAAQLQATKHNPTMAFQNVRSASEFVSSNRTLGGGQWDAAIMASPNTPPTWNVDQFGTDLQTGDVGNLNFLIPDQCDDMHGLTVTGPISGGPATGTASDCGGNALIYRSDTYVDNLIQKIQASPVWRNIQKRVAVVIMFDEGTATSGLNSCCGWNPAGKPGYSSAGPLGVLVQNPDGTTSVDTTIVRYNNGNKGHGTSVFGVVTNQTGAPKGVVDSDAYSHMSFVRTLQDMFGLADPENNWSYMNRSKYTQSFIAANILFLPEYAANLTDPHFDAVRAMNHRYMIPAGYVQKTGFITPPGAQIGPDANQLNAWAVDFSTPLQWRRPPTASSTTVPAPNAAGWNNTPVAVTLVGTDEGGGAGVTTMKYTLSGAQTGGQTVAGNQTTVLITAEGQTTLAYFAQDFLGKQSPPQNVVLKLDLTAPVIAFSGNVGSYGVDQVVNITCAASDSLSGLSASVCPGASGPAYAFPLGSNTLNASATDRAGNSATRSATFTVGVSFAGLSNLTEQFVTQHGIANSLTAKLAAAEDAARRGNLQARDGALNAYINEVNAQRGKALTEEQADLLVQFAGTFQDITPPGGVQ